MDVDAADREQFDRIFADYYEPVSRYCHRRLPPQDANDATAEVFVVAWKKIADMPAGNALPWLYGVARLEVNRARRSRRRRGALAIKLRGQAARFDPGPEALVIRNTEHERLLLALAKLKPEDHEVLRLRAYEHLTIPEVALVLGCSVSAAKQRSARAIKRLRRVAKMTGPPERVPEPRAIAEGGDG